MYKIRIVNKQFSVCPTCHPQLQKHNGGRDNASIHGDDFVVSSLSCVRLVATPWTVVHQASLFFTTSGVCSNLCPLSQWCHSTISSSVTPFSSCPESFPAWVFINELVLCIRWPKYWSFNFSISPSNDYKF